jgi:ABC-type phosphate transport system substrate-binding protein
MISKKLLLGTMLLASSINLAFAELVVIVHPANNATVDTKTIQRIFLGKEKKFSDGKQVNPINLEASNTLRTEFDTQVVGRSSSQVSAYWSKLVFTGKGIPPKEVANDAEVISLVAKNPSDIGYIDRASVTDAVKVIEL